jgi:hypothetical protein
VLLKQTVIKGVCRGSGSGVTLAPPFTGDVSIVLRLGTTDRYCALFGGDEVKNDPTLTKRKSAQPPRRALVHRAVHFSTEERPSNGVDDVASMSQPSRYRRFRTTD